MNKRLRKKKRVGEFTEWGFAVTGTCEIGDADGLFVALADTLPAHITYGGSLGGGGFDYYFTGLGRKSMTDADRQLVADSFGKAPVGEFAVEQLSDAWSRSAIAPLKKDGGPRITGRGTLDTAPSQ